MSVRTFLSDKIMVQARTLIADSGGGSSALWADFCSVWARVEPGRAQKPGGETILETARPVIVHMRYAPDLPDPMQFLWQGRVLRVLAIQRNDERAAMITVQCEEVVS